MTMEMLTFNDNMKTTSPPCSCCSQPNTSEQQNRDSTAQGKEVHYIICTKLHELCIRGAGIDEVRSFTEKCPLSPRTMDRFGRSPLFWAIKLKRPDEIIRHIYTQSPDMLLSHDVYGKTCLDLLYAPPTKNIRVLRWLFDRDPSIVMSRLDLGISRTPSTLIMSLLHRICIRWALSPRNEWDDLEVVMITIDAAHRYQCCHCHWSTNGQEQRSIPLLHKAMRLRLPSLVLRRIATFFPEDMYPCQSISSICPLHYFLLHYTPEEDDYAILFSLQLLNFDHRAAQECFRFPNGIRTWPLHVAIQNGYAWKSMSTIHQIVSAAPWVLHAVDEETQLLPFQIAATTECLAVNETAQLDAIYDLLRSQPSVITEVSHT